MVCFASEGMGIAWHIADLSWALFLLTLGHRLSLDLSSHFLFLLGPETVRGVCASHGDDKSLRKQD